MMKYKELGLKMTPQRLSIISFLEGNKDHPTAEDIYKKISKKFPTISLATVYKTLETLKRHGVINEITIDPNRRHFDPNLQRHHHLICSRCRKIADLDIDFDLVLPEDTRKGFDIIGNHVEFYGLCIDCKKK
ncbi:MAG TPA: transcriptional repressor [Dissulfurispiraceae bacterium]|nr:transcriptional repressor [Dissulfurispiraceae bacterium]